jgi:hypothetical protein
MPSFKDTEGREWTMRVDVQTVRDVRTATGVDIARLLSTTEGHRALHDDVCQLVDIIYEICKRQSITRGVSAEDFGRSLAGDSLDGAIIAFEEAIIEFLPESQSRSIARSVIDAGREIQAKGKQKIRAAIGSGLIRNRIEEELAKLDASLATQTTPTNFTDSVSGR